MGGNNKKKNVDPFAELYDASFEMKQQSKMLDREAAKAMKQAEQ